MAGMIAQGLLAGAAGTLALDIYTYADIFATARPASSLPSTTVQKIAEQFDITGLAGDGDDASNRRSGAGALLGYGVGLGAAAGYAFVRPLFRSWLPWPIAGALLGAATLVVSEGSSTALGATDWSQWTPSEWLADIVPRTVYGLTVAAVCERFLQEREERRAPERLPADP